MSTSKKQKIAIEKPAWQSACHDLVEIEIGRLVQEHVYVMAENDNYVVLRAMADQIPHALYEIGRLRELTALARGDDGAGRIVDLDHFDLYYIHIVIWNKKNREITGACRLGQMDIILKRFGMSGLYAGTVFRYSPLFQQEIGPALEMGKMFIRAEYQRQYAPLSLLWKGIGRFIAYNPRYKTLVSLLSISKHYSSLSRRTIVSFLKKNSFSSRAAKLIEPVISAPGAGAADGTRAVRSRLKDLAALTNLVSEIETDGKGIPYDLKRFVKAGGKLAGFGRHPSGKNIYCGLVLLDLTACGRGVLSHCMGKSGLGRYFDYHGGREERAA